MQEIKLPRIAFEYTNVGTVRFLFTLKVVITNIRKWLGRRAALKISRPTKLIRKYEQWSPVEALGIRFPLQ